MPHLWTGAGNPPVSYNTYRLCVIFHCLPSQLRCEGIEDVLALIAYANADVEIQQQKDGQGLDPSARGQGVPGRFGNG